MLPLGVKLGAPVAYENCRNESSLMPLFAGVHEHPLPSKWSIKDGSKDTLCSVLLSVILTTGRLASAMESTVAVRFLKAVITEGNSPLLKLLLKHGVNIHQRTDDTSAVEEMCQAETALKLSSSSAGRRIISAILDRANVERLKDLTPDEEGLGLLHRLATHENASGILWLVKDLVRRGLDVNAVSAQGSGHKSVLVHHADLSSFECAEALLELGADPTAVPLDEFTFDAAQAAMSYGNVSFLNKLFAYTTATTRATGPRMDWTRRYGIVVTLGKDPSKAIVGNAFHLASMNGVLEGLDFYLDHKLISGVDEASSDGHTALHFAAISSNVHVIDFLASRGANVMAKADDGSTPLHYAARNGHLVAVKALLRHGATESRDALARSPRMYAARLGHQDVVRCLEDTLGPDTATQAPPDSQHPSLSANQLKLMTKALEKAILSHDLDECERLIASGCPVDVAMPECGSCTALIRAILMENVDIVRCLLGNGARATKSACAEHGGHHNSSALELAISRAELNPIITEMVGKTADTALLNGAIAFLRSRFDAFRSKLGLETFRELLNLQPAKGWSPLCRAASLNLVDIMENCLSMGAKVDFEG
ncbi:hypothetical protein NKR19_g9690 [Coniochaeta hoffmannii]|uniref:Ankyrin n=1 Tax=Coniochaeta hoffmannii TaxID=91930 RepID=A0AA38R0U7_9PEZI|nr:hypothetical protein NKR19_g9690 [Coniochaeta hoffmannii]